LAVQRWIMPIPLDFPSEVTLSSRENNVKPKWFEPGESLISKCRAFFLFANHVIWRSV